MFENCQNIQYLKVYFDNWGVNSYIYNSPFTYNSSTNHGKIETKNSSSFSNGNLKIYFDESQFSFKSGLDTNGKSLSLNASSQTITSISGGTTFKWLAPNISQTGVFEMPEQLSTVISEKQSDYYSYIPSSWTIEKFIPTEKITKLMYITNFWGYDDSNEKGIINIIENYNESLSSIIINIDSMVKTIYDEDQEKLKISKYEIVEIKHQ